MRLTVFLIFIVANIFLPFENLYLSATFRKFRAFVKDHIFQNFKTFQEYGIHADAIIYGIVCSWTKCNQWSHRLMNIELLMWGT